MKLFTMVLLAALSSLSFAARDLGHESGGRVAANTVYVRFSSRGAGINTKAFEAVQSLIKLEADAGQVVKTLSKPWGREGEKDVCVSLKMGRRLPFTLALDRVVRLLHAEGEVGWQVGVGLCTYWPTENYTGQDTAYVTESRDDAKQVSLDCVNADVLPNSYHYHLAFFETLDANKQPKISYRLQQSSRSARYMPLSGTVEKASLGFVEGVVSFQYTFDGELVTVQPTAQAKDGGTLYLGTASKGGNPIRLQCVSGRVQGPIR